MVNTLYLCKTYKMKLVRAERDIFGFPVSSEEWDKVVKVLDEDVRQEVFKFVHPKRSDIVYERNYEKCPVSGNAIITLGRLRDTTDYTHIHIVTKSYTYKEPYIVFEDYYPAFPNPKILEKIVMRSFKWALEKYGLEMIIKPWESEKPIYWMMDSVISYNIELKKHPEIAKQCFGFQKALVYQTIVKESIVKNERMSKKKFIKSDRIEDYIIKGDKVLIIKMLHELIDNKITTKNIIRPIRFLCDHGVFYDNEAYRLPYKAFIKEFPTAKEYISSSTYNDWLNPMNQKLKLSEKYKSLENIFKFVL